MNGTTFESAIEEACTTSKAMRYVKDSIHNQISFKPFFWDVIDTPQF